MFATFKARAEAVSAEVHRFATRADALEFIVGVMASAGVADAPGGGAVWADGPFLQDLDRPGLSQRVPGLRFDVTRERAADAKVGVSQVDWAVADTGTLAQAVDAADQRLVSTLPSIHVALASSDRIVPDLAGLLARLSPRHARYLALVTGPSRTADIERVLTVGVQGPGKVMTLFVDDLSE
jgi:L-lactate dehydrogenase complex protein LldG